MRLTPAKAAEAFVNKYFPHSNVVILGGSVVRGEATKTSDLDIFIIDENEKSAYRESFYEFDWMIEAFIHTRISYQDFFERDRQRAKPSLPKICAEGLIIKDDGTAQQIQQEAIDLLENGAIPWTSNDIIQARYGISDCLEDFIGSNNHEEDIFIAGKLTVLLHEFVLRVNGHWIGDGKWIVRALKKYDDQFFQRYFKSFDAFYNNGEKEGIITLVDDVLKPYGGRLFQGFSQGKKIK